MQDTTATGSRRPAIVTTLSLGILVALIASCDDKPATGGTSNEGCEAGSCVDAAPGTMDEGGVFERPARPLDELGIEAGVEADADVEAGTGAADGSTSQDGATTESGCANCAALRGLLANFGVLEPAFAPATTAYTLRPDAFATSVELVATAPGGASLRIDGVSHPSALPYPVDLASSGTQQVTITSGDGDDAISYTVSIVLRDPLEEMLVPEEPGIGDSFGFSIALSDDGRTMAVGAYGDASSSTGVDGDQNDDMPSAGAVYIFDRTAQGWEVVAYIKAFEVDADDRFGTSVALSGDGNVLAVTSLYEDSTSVGIDSTPNDAGDGQGAVYTYRRVNGRWFTDAYFKQREAGERQYGTAVALDADGSVLAVGAVSALNTLGDAAGCVYIYERGAAGWRGGEQLFSSNGYNGQRFGGAIALSAEGSTLAVGARSDRSSTTGINSVADALAPNAGAAYIFEKSTAAGWQQAAYVKARNAEEDDRFGEQLALDAAGTRLVVGARYEDSLELDASGAPTGTAENSGAVYVYDRSAQGWAPSKMLKAPDARALDGFGGALALTADGRRLLVGASSYPATLLSPSEYRVGKAYVFDELDGEWRAQTAPDAPDEDTALFGQAAAISGDGSTLALGAPYHAELGLPRAGAVYTYAP